MIKPFPKKKYFVIYADPPWTYQDLAGAGDRGLENKYPTLSLTEIKNLPVPDICYDNAFLFLWVTFPLLKEGIEVLEAWGFKYKTVAFTWTKTTRNGNEFIGMGNYTRANPEICLLGKKGTGAPILSHRVRNLTKAQARKHSQKPNLIRDKITELLGKDITRIELFARSKIPGWDTWGNDDNLDDNVKSLNDYFQ
jgi:site-specific DNA-methyltransferase (adenine-specific)